MQTSVNRDWLSMNTSGPIPMMKISIKPNFNSVRRKMTEKVRCIHIFPSAGVITWTQSQNHLCSSLWLNTTSILWHCTVAAPIRLFLSSFYQINYYQTITCLWVHPTLSCKINCTVSGQYAVAVVQIPRLRIQSNLNILALREDYYNATL